MKALLLILSVTLSGCAGSVVGGDRNYGKNNELVSRYDTCKGACLEISSDGNCVEFTKGISDVCIDYFNNIKK